MNRQRAYAAQPQAPADESIVEPGAVPRVWLQNTTRSIEPTAAACMLIVDDIDSKVQLLERVLRMAGATSIHTFTNAQLAIDHCLEVCPDLVLIDFDTPHVDGCAVLNSLRHALPDDGFLPVIVLTGATITQGRDRAAGMGANDFLTKPYDSCNIVQRVINLLTMRALYREVERHNLEPHSEPAPRA